MTYSTAFDSQPPLYKVDISCYPDCADQETEAWSATWPGSCGQAVEDRSRTQLSFEIPLL